MDDLTKKQKRVLSRALDLFDANDAWPPTRILAERMHLCQTSIVNYYKQFEKKGYIEPNEYGQGWRRTEDCIKVFYTDRA